MDRYTFPSEQNCPTTTERLISDGTIFADQLHPCRCSGTHLVLKVDAQAAVEAEGTKGRRFIQVVSLPTWRL